ncbi:epiplakin [Caretta caretta]|uniref:epiplakin n=1 Tax=Caretta caretta TaxID=8467 RepID=UPI003F4B6BF1
MEHQPAVNGHATPTAHPKDTPGGSHFHQGMQPGKRQQTGVESHGVGEPLAGTGTIAGVYVEASKKTMSFYDATREHFLMSEPALALLEAQAATGSLIDPVGNKQLSVAEAVRLGLVGLELKEKLLSAERAAIGFMDPYTDEKISLYQAIQKELLGRDRGARLLEVQIATGGLVDPATSHRLPMDVTYEQGHFGDEMSQLLSDPSSAAARGFLDPNTSETVTYLELKKRCMIDPSTGLLLLPLKITFPGLRGRVSSSELLSSSIIDMDTFRALEEGRVSVQEVAEMDHVQQYLEGTGSIAGVAILPTGERKSLYQALTEHLLMPGTALALLQAQAATACLTEPTKSQRLSVDDGVKAGVVGPELYEKLSSAERAATGYRDPYTGELLSLFQAMNKGLIARDQGTYLLEAQLATGGLIDPVHNHRVPVEVACQRGYLDEEMKRLLFHPTHDMKGFFDPNTKETLMYAELLERCVTDPDTGLRLLPLFGENGEGSQGMHSFIDHRTRMALEDTTVPVACGKFKGKSVSLWKLLFSDYFTNVQRATYTQQCRTATLSMKELAKTISTTVQQMASTANTTFEGLRHKVTPSQLLSADIINRDLFEKLSQGETSAREVVCMDTVRKYLEGTGSISGLLLPDSQEKISIYQAKRKGLLMPGTSLILLEAQAATGFIIDPTANKKYSVEEALRANVIGPDIYNKLLAAEKAVTGYKDPYTGNKISLFQAMSKGHLIRDHGIRLLEAQIATGGIIDPLHSHRLPVEVAYKRGYFDKKMNRILSDPSVDTKGFFDPNTHENLTYLQLKEKCITEPSTGLCLLPLNSKKRQFINDTTKQAFRSTWLLVKYGRFQGERVSVWDLLNSEYFSEGKRREIFNHYQLRKLTLEQIRLTLEEEMKKWAHIKFPAMRGSVTAYHLLETGIIDKALFERVLEGTVSPEDVLRMDSVRKYLYGSGSIGGIVLQPSNQRMSIYEAMKQKIVMPGVALPLLEAQAATGFVINPVNNQKLCVDEAVREGVIGPELHEKLQHAEGAVMGYKDPFTGEKISLFQAMKKGLIADKQAIQLMEAQIATGGIIDPHHGHYVPVEFAQKQGYLDEDMSKTLSSASDNTRVYCIPNSKEPVTYAQLIAHCQKDENSGLHLLPLPQTAVPVCTDEQIQKLFKDTMVKAKGVSLWELIHSGYFTEEQRNDFVEKYRSEDVSVWQLVTLVLKLVEEIEMKAHTHITFEGLRGSVPAVWLFDAGIITEKTFVELAKGKQTAGEVAKMESVKRYLQGTGSIAGIFIQASKKRMSIYQAMKNNLLLPGTGVLLLEAQAATGAVIDPVTNQKLGVEDAVKAAIVGEELMEKLLLAERAVTGYTDPYTGNSISVCQAVRKGLIPMSDAVPLIEAQLATGGVIDPIHHHHLPLPAAYMHGFYDEEMNQALSQPTDNTKVFFDPNTKENLTYQQLKDKCVPDAETGLWLLPLSETAAFYVDKQTMEVLKSVTVCVAVGRFKGQTVCLWDLLNSEYITDCKQRELVKLYKGENTVALQEIITTVTTIIEESEKQGKRFTFKGLRKQVSASDLFESQLIDKKTLDELKQGQKTVKEVTEMDAVRRYLEGGNFIAGVLIQPANEKMSIYQAMTRSMLRPGTALVLLEAQAATGFVIDPVKNKRLSVEEALAAGLIGQEVYEKLLSAERAVTGYTDPYTKGQISLFEAMNQGLILKSHGIRLLEAQVATGGIIDPVHSHRLPVEVAYKRGYFDEEMNRILCDPSDDTKGFFDPNTHENLTYIQLLERCVQDPETGLYMLQIVKHGGRYFYIDESMKQFLCSKPIKMHVGKFKGQTVSLWDLLCSQYISEQKRKELVKQYKCETLTIEQLITVITTIIEEMELRTQALKVKGLRGDVSVSELFNAEIIDKTTLDNLQKGTLTVHKLTQMDSVKRYLDGTGCIAGVLLPAKKERMSIYQARERGLLTPESALVLLEAQAATGFIIDPLKNEKLSVDEAVSAGLVGSEVHEKLLSAERAVTGYTDPYTGNKISLFQAMKKDLLVKDYGIPLLEAQIATGGIIDPVHSHRLPVEMAYKRGYLDDDTFLLLSDPQHGNKRFMDPNTKEKLSYAQLLHRCSKDPETGLCLLQIIEKKEDYFYTDEQTKNTMLSTMVQVQVGKYKGHNLSLWELLCSEYITEEKRKELVKRYKKESTAILQKIIDIILTIIHEKERSRKDIWFQGIRQKITASELLNAQIITKDTMEKLEEGKQTAKDIAKMDAIKRYLEGTSCIAGVLVPSNTDPSRTEKMSIYQAMWKGILRPGTALVLLEAQAATGFITDPLKNEKLSVDEAVSAGLVGSEVHEKLLSAERAVTGYTDPYTGNKISLFQAMKKDLLVKDHGIRLLEAQIATGGIIDPVHSHRLPVEVAYKRGYFDEEMNRILCDPSDDTKGFFDPNTHENLTYMQLLSRCVPDPDTGLLMLQLMHKGSVLFQLDEQTRISLQSAPATVSVGLFQGQNVTVWELLFSRYVPDQKRQELLKKYKAGTLTIQEMTTIITTLITETEKKSGKEPRGVEGPRREERTSGRAASAPSPQDEQAEKTLRFATVDVSVGEFQGRKVSVWELLFSKYLSEEKRQEVLEKYRAGTVTLEELVRILTTIVEEKEERSSKLKFSGLRRQVTASELFNSDIIDQNTLTELTQGTKTVQEITEMDSVKRYLQGTSCIAGVLVPSNTDPSRTEKMSIYQAMWKGILRPGTALVLLEAQAATGFITDPLKNEKLSVDEAVSAGLVGSEVHEKLLSAERAVTGYTDPYTGNKISLFQAMKKDLLVKDHGIRLLEAQIATGGIIDPVHSHRLPVEVAYKRGYFDEEMNRILCDPSDDTKGFFDPNTHENLTYMQLLSRCVPDPDTGLLMLQLMHKGSVLFQLDEQTRISLQSAPATVSVGLFQGQNVTVWELLFSRYVPDQKRQELLKKYKAGTLTIQEITTIITTLITETEKKSGKEPRGVEGPRREERTSGRAASAPSPQDEQAEKTLRFATVDVSVGEFQGRKVSVWELLFSKYLSEEKRQEVLEKYRAGTVTLEELVRILTTIVEEKEERSSKLKFSGLRRQVTASELFNSDIIDQNTLTELTQGTKTVQEITEMDSVKRYLQGTSCIAGVLVPSNTDPSRTEKMSIYQAMWKGILRPGTALVLLEAQAATGFITDPLKNEKLSVDEAVSAGLVGSEVHEKLLSAERAVTGYTDPYTGNKISLFQAMKKDLLVKDHGIRLLEAQIATGGIIDPVHSHRLPVEVAYKRGYFDEEMNRILCDPSDDTKGFFDPNTHENLTYMQLLSRCVPDPDTGLLMLQLMHKGSVLFQLDEQTRISLQSAPATVSVGLFQGQNVTVWELLFSRYVPDQKRQELLKKYKAGTLTIQEMTTIITTLITETEKKSGKEPRGVEGPRREERTSGRAASAPSPQDEQAEKTLRLATVDVSVGEFQGRKVSVWELLFSKYLSEEKRQEVLEKYRAGTMTLEELVRILTTIVEEKEERSSKLKFSGLRRQVTASELFSSDIIDQNTLTELTQGTKTVQEITEMDSVKRYLQGTSCIAGVLVPSNTDPSRTEKMSIYQAMWKGILRPGTALVLLEAQAATGFITDPLKNEKLSVDEAVSAGLVGSEVHEKLLSAERAVTGYTDPYTGNKISLFQAMKKDLLVKDHGIRLLEAQIATGGIIDPVHSHRLPVEVAYKRGYFDEEMNRILCDPSDDTKGFFDPNTHENLTYMQLLSRCVPDPDTGLLMLQLMHKGSVLFQLDEQTRISLQSAPATVSVGLFQGQNVTVWELLFSRYVPDQKRQELLKKYKAGTLTIQEMTTIITTLITETEKKSGKEPRGVEGPRREERTSGRAASAPSPQDEQAEKTLRFATVDVSVGEFQGRKVSVWELLFSKYLSEEKRQEVLEKYRAGTVTLEELVRILTTIVEEKEERSSKLKFSGLRRQVTASELFSSDIIDQNTLTELTQGTKTVQEITEMDSVKRYLQGTSCIAGVLVPSNTDPSRTEKMSIYQAMWKGILRPGTALVLLEAQAATGFITDPLKNEKLSVDEAVSAGLVGSEVHEKLLSAERAVTGYTDPYTGNKISLFQAMKKDLLVKDHGIRLLEAQIATGGIIDPVHSHRLPVEVAYKRGYFDEEMNRILCDPSDDTKGFFDPNTHENLTYMQLLSRCVPDPDTGLLMLQLMHKGSVLFQLDEQTRISLQSAPATVSVGLFQGQNVTVWELLFSRYVPDQKRQELLKKYKAGTLTIQEMTTIITTLITETEKKSGKEPRGVEGPRREERTSGRAASAPSPQDEQAEKTLRLATVDVSVGEFQGRKVSVWELLFSKYLSEEKRQEVLEKYRAGTVTLEELVRILTTIVEEKEERSSKLKFSGLRRQVTASELFSSDIIDQNTLTELTQGTKTVQEITEMDSVKRYLQGTSCIAGVLVPSNTDPSRTEKMSIYQAMWKGILRPGTALVLLEAQAATGFITDPLKNEKLSVDEAVSAGLVGSEVHEKLLSAERAVTGYTDPYTGNKISLFQAMKKDLLVKDHGIRLLEAQIATGGIIDPVHSHRLPVEVAYKRGYFDEEMNRILCDPSDDTKGFFDPNTHENLTYMQLLSRCVPDPDTGLLMLQLMHKGSVLFQLDEQTRISLQSAPATVSVGLFQGQNVTVWELLFSRYVPDQKRQELLKKYKAGTLTIQEMTTIITTLITETEKKSGKEPRGVEGPRREERTSGRAASAPSPQDEQAEKTLRLATVDVSVGEFQGRKVSVWELLFSKYLSEEKRQEVLEKYRAGTVTLEELVRILTTIVEEKEERSSKLKFSGLRRQVTASELFSSDIIDQNTLTELTQGTKTVQEITEMDSVKRYLQGTSCIAGVLVPSNTDPSRTEKMSIYQAMWKGILRPGTALVLLEAQAATGFITDPLKNEKLSVDEAVSAGLVGSEVHEKLLSAERAVTGYTDPYTGNKISLFQAMKKDLLVKDHGIRLLEAQIATGGIIDPVHSHRLPVEVAYKRGYFDEEMNRILCDPSDDTKGFFDPNTHENLTYMQLLSRCVPDPDTGLLMLQLMHKGSVLFQLDEQTRISLQSAPATVSVGLFQGQNVTVWELLFSRYVPDQKRQELLKKYKAGTLTIQEMTTIITTLITETEKKSGKEPRGVEGPRREERTSGRAASAPSPQDEQAEKTLRLATVDVSVGEFQGRKVSVWELLFSKYLSEEKRQEVLEKYRAGTVTLEELVRILTTIVEEKEERSSKLKFSGLRRQVTASELFSSDIIDQNTLTELTQGTKTVQEITEMDSVKRYLEGTSCIAGVLVPSNTDPSRTEKMSIYQAMWKGILRPGTALVLLEAQAATGFITDPLKNEKLSVDEAVSAGLVGSEVHEKLLSAERAVTGYTDPYTGNKISLFQAMKKDLLVKDHGIRLLEAQIATGGIIDPVHSHRLPVEVAYKRGYFDEEMNRILCDPSDDTKGFFDPNTHENLTYMQLLSRCVPDPDTGLLMLQLMHKGSVLFQLDEQTRISLQSAPATVSVGLFQGQNVTVWELLFSRYVPDQKRQELLKKYKAGTLTIQEMTTIITTLITETEKKSGKEPRGVEGPRREERTSGRAASAPSPQDEQAEKTLRLATVDVSVGEFQGRKVSVWELLFSKYLSEEKRQEVLEKYRAGTVTLEELVRILTTIVEEKEERSSKLKFSGLRRQVTASELFSSDIIDQNTLTELTQGTKTVQEITEMDSVKRYLQGTSCIAGVLVPSNTDPSRTEKMSIYQAMWKGILRPGTALVLLEAQAATGFITDPLKNEKLSVDEAVSAGLVGSEVHEKLLSAERAVTGYTDPYTGNKISLFQAMKKDLLVKDHGIRLLEAQIATGGIIDPVHSHRLPVEVAYKRGYFDEEMNRILCDPSDDTKGFFDPNTHENLTYMQLLSRCVPDPDTGLLMLQLMHKGSVLFQLDEQTRISLQSAPATVSVGLFQGQNVTVWELLFSRYVPDQKRQELLKKYKAGTLTIQEMTTIITTLITETEKKSGKEPRGVEGPRREERTSGRAASAPSPQDEQAEKTLRLATVDVSVGEFQGRKVSVWELLFSKYLSEEKRQEVLEKYRAGTVTLEELVRILTTIVEEKEERSSKLKFSGLRRQVTASELFSSDIIDQNTLTELTQGTKTVQEITEMDSVKRYLQGTSCIAGVLVPSNTDPSRTEKMSIYQAMWKGILRPGTALVLLEAQAATGFITDPLKNEKLSVDEAVSAGLVGSEVHEKLLSAERAVTGYTDPYTGNKISLFQAMKKDLLVKDHGIRLLEAQIATGGIIDPVHSHRLPVEVAYKRGYFDEEMNRILCDPSDDTKGFFDPNTHENLTYMQLLSRCVPDPDTGLCLLKVGMN